MRPRKFRRKKSRDEPADLVVPEELGILAQEVPEDLIAGLASDGSLTVGVMQYVTMLLGAVQQLDARVRELEPRGKS